MLQVKGWTGTLKKKKKSKLQSIRNFGSLMRSELERCGLVMLLGLQEHNETWQGKTMWDNLEWGHN